MFHFLNHNLLFLIYVIQLLIHLFSNQYINHYSIMVQIYQNIHYFIIHIIKHLNI